MFFCVYLHYINFPGATSCFLSVQRTHSSHERQSHHRTDLKNPHHKSHEKDKSSALRRQLKHAPLESNFPLCRPQHDQIVEGGGLPSPSRNDFFEDGSETDSRAQIFVSDFLFHIRKWHIRGSLAGMLILKRKPSIYQN